MEFDGTMASPRTPPAQIGSAHPFNPYAPTFVPTSVMSPPIGTMAVAYNNALALTPLHCRLDPPIQTVQFPVSSAVVNHSDVPVPYISSVWDDNIVRTMKPAPDFAYYVPPRVEDHDYFGGQIRVWQDKMVPTFELFLPDVWTLHGLPFFSAEFQQDCYFFTITCKLRFSCRKCFKPWTSMRGKIHFAFKLDRASSRGTILMKIFGQVCNQDGCDDQNFQTPACYPEEIHRVLVKLSEYIGYVLYFVPLSPTFYNEPDKAVRGGNPRSPHRPALCQACQQGICSRRTQRYVEPPPPTHMPLPLPIETPMIDLKNVFQVVLFQIPYLA